MAFGGGGIHSIVHVTGVLGNPTRDMNSEVIVFNKRLGLCLFIGFISTKFIIVPGDTCTHLHPCMWDAIHHRGALQPSCFPGV